MDINIYTLLVGIVASGIVEVLKNIKSIPLNGGQTKALRIVTGAIVLAGTLISEFQTTGTLSGQTIEVVSSGIVSYFFAYLTYKGFIAKGTTETIEKRLG